MTVESARWLNAEETRLAAVIDGREWVGITAESRLWSRVMDGGVSISACAMPVTTVLDVKLEAQRRINALAPEWKQRNWTARGVELMRLRIENGSWTAEEQAEADALQAAWTAIKAVREASDALEAALPVADVTADEHWP